MWTLALETTTSHGSMALLRFGRGDIEPHLVDERVLEARNYAAEVFRAASELFAAARIQLADIGLFAVADGPGSFTGVRIGLSAVKAWVEVLGVPAASISTLRAIAAHGPDRQPVLAALDASRGEVFTGFYPGGAGPADQADALELLEPLDCLHRRLDTIPPVPAFTPHPGLRDLCPRLELIPPRLAAAVGRLGLTDFRAGRRQSALELDARYIRRSDAEVALHP